MVTVALLVRIEAKPGLESTYAAASARFACRTEFEFKGYEYDRDRPRSFRRYAS